MEKFEISHLRAFFREINNKFPTSKKYGSFLITHLLAERPSFVRAVNAQTKLISVLSKPKSINKDALKEVSTFTQVDHLNRTIFADIDSTLEYFENRAGGQKVILLDIGGYFAGILNDLVESFSGQIVGVVEDTENGLQRYEKIDSLCPVFSVARSPLKYPEDYLVGQSVAFSTEMLIRNRGDIIPGSEALVIGYGKLGNSISHMLSARNMRVTIFDHDPIKMTHARASGFRVVEDKRSGLSSANVIIGATGNFSLTKNDFPYVKQGAYIASVTSAEDEFEMNDMDYQRYQVTSDITKYSDYYHHFYMLADGNAINFLHGAVVGSYIYLVQSEILACVSKQSNNEYPPGMYTLSDSDRKVIASTWLNFFN